MGSIYIKSIVMNYNELEVFDRLTELIHDGETYLLIGQSGSGKSSLMKAMAGLLYPDEGEIQVKGENIVNYNKFQMLDYHVRSGYVFQNAALISNMTLYENLALFYEYHTDMTKDEIRDRIHYYIEMIGYSGTLDVRPSTLSMGERMMICIVRAISHNPEYLFFDEPTASLDPVATKRTKEIIADQKKQGKTIMLVSHDLQFGFSVADRVGVLHEGKIVESGTPDEIMHSKMEITNQLLSSR